MSKKQEAFELFGQGKRPGDKEVKDLGLSAKARYNYFQEYKKSVGETASDVDDISELRKERTRLALLSQIEELESKRQKLPDRVEGLERQQEALAEYLGEVLHALTTLSSENFRMIRSDLQHFHDVTKEDLDQWEPMEGALKAFRRLADLEPIPEKLRKLNRRS